MSTDPIKPGAAQAMQPDPIGCSAGCRRQVADVDEALRLAWERLEITGRYRCPQCRRELIDINRRTHEPEPPPMKTPQPDPIAIENLAARMYHKAARCHPTWEQLSDTTRASWLERAARELTPPVLAKRRP